MRIDQSRLRKQTGRLSGLRMGKSKQLSRLSIVMATIVLLGAASAAQAGLLTVNLTGVDLRFKGAQTDIVDDDGDALNAPGNTDPNIADDVDAATFKNGAALEGEWMTSTDDIRADLLIEDGLATLATNSPTSLPLAGGTNEFVWFVDDGTYLRLQLDVLEVTRTPLPFSLPEIFVMTGTATVIGNQTLPNGMKFAGPVGVAYVSTDTMFLGNDDGLIASGVLTITGDMVPVPEPATFALASLGLLISLAGKRHRRNQ